MTTGPPKPGFSRMGKIIASAARYLFAINQSRAKIVLDPLYSAAARSLLRGSIPLSPQLKQRQYADNLYEAYRDTSRKLQYFIEDWDFSQARPDLLTARERSTVHTTTLGETSGMAVSDGFLRAFRTSTELACFFGTWFVEELNHFRGFHRYAEIMGERWSAERVYDVAEVRFHPYSDDMHEIAACNMYQELVAFLVYRSFGRQVRDPFLARMVKQIAKDELRHNKFYEAVVARRIQRDPSFRVTVLKTFLKATTPYNQVSGGARATLDNIANGFFYFRKAEYDYFLDSVEFLLGTRLESAFDRYFRMFAPPCDRCKIALFLCECEEFEDHPAAAELVKSSGLLSRR